MVAGQRPPVRPTPPPAACSSRCCCAAGRPPPHRGWTGQPAPAGSHPSADAGPRPSWPARSAPRRSWTWPVTPSPTPPGRTGPPPRPAGRPRTGPPAPAGSDTGDRRHGAAAPGWWSGGRPWPGTGAVRSAASTGPARARPCCADRSASRSRSSPRRPWRPPPAWSATPAGSSPSPASAISSRSRSSRSCPVSRCTTFSHVSALAPVRAEATIFATMTTPGRIVFAEIRYSAARLNSSVGESCSIARSSRNCSRSFIASLPAGAVFQLRYVSHQPQMIRASMRALPVPLQHRRVQPHAVCQPGHRPRRRRRHLIRYEPKPRQRRELNREPKPISRSTAMTRINEGDIGRRQREVPDQVVLADIGKRPQLLQLILGEHARRHRPPQTSDPGKRYEP